MNREAPSGDLYQGLRSPRWESEPSIAVIQVEVTGQLFWA